MDIIRYLLNIIQQQSELINFLLNFIRKFIPISQWMHDDSKSPKYNKFSVDELPVILPFYKQDWQFLIEYYKHKYGKAPGPVRRRNGKSIPEDISCPYCGAPHTYLYDNNGNKGQFQCKVCAHTFLKNTDRPSPLKLRCPHCGHALSHKRDRKFFRVYVCPNTKFPHYLQRLKKVDKAHLDEEYGRSRYRLHYVYREFTVDFFSMDLRSLPKNSSSLKFTKHNAHIMSLCLTFHVNLQLSLRKTAQAMKDLYGIDISHQQVANYARTASLVIKPFVDNYEYSPSSTLIADETYIKVKGIKGYVWLIMDAASRSILGYFASDTRSVGPCILVMRMALRLFKKLPENFSFIADGYSAYPLAAQQFLLKLGNDFKFDITQVIGLTNDDAVSKEFRPFKQMVERLNRTFKESYRVKCGYDNFEGANYNLALWVAYYNFLRPHKHNGLKTLNKVDMLDSADNMPGKWQLLILLGQQTIARLQDTACS